MKLILILILLFGGLVGYHVMTYDMSYCAGGDPERKGALYSMNRCVEDYVKYCNSTKLSNLQKNVEIEGKLYYAYPAGTNSQTLVECLYKNREGLAKECKQTLDANKAYDENKAKAESETKQNFEAFVKKLWKGVDDFALQMAGKIKCTK